MGAKTVRNIKRAGNFCVIKIIPAKLVIRGIYFDKKYEKLMKLRDRQGTFWFMLFAILEVILRPYIFEIVIGLSIAVLLANMLFYILFLNREEKVDIQLSKRDFYEVVNRKYRAWRQNFTMAITFVCLARLLIFVQQKAFSDFEITAVYCISLAVSFFTIIIWLYYGGIQNQLKRELHIVRKKKRKGFAEKHKRMKYIQ